MAFTTSRGNDGVLCVQHKTFTVPSNCFALLFLSVAYTHQLVKTMTPYTVYLNICATSPPVLTVVVRDGNDISASLQK